MSKVVEANRSSLFSDNKQEDEQYVSYDAPPLDFSFKNIKSIAGNWRLIQNSKTSNLVKVKKLPSRLKITS